VIVLYNSTPDDGPVRAETCTSIVTLRCDIPIVLVKSQIIQHTLEVKTQLHYYDIYIADDGNGQQIHASASNRPSSSCTSITHNSTHISPSEGTPYHSNIESYTAPFKTDAESHLSGPPATAPHQCSSLPQHTHRYCLILKSARRQLLFYFILFYLILFYPPNCCNLSKNM